MRNERILCMIGGLGSGGAERQLSGLAAMLKDNGYEVKVLTLYNKPFYLPILKEHTVEYEYVFTKPRRTLFMIPKVVKAIDLFSPDVIISYLNTNELVCITKLLRKKYYVIVSERNTTQNLTFRGKIKFSLYKIADFIVSNSYSQTAFINKYFPKLSKKTVTITNFVDTDLFAPAEKVKNNNGYLEILCVGRITEQKNVLRFIEAAHIVYDRGRKFHVSWYGRPKEPYYSICKSRIKELDFETVFEFKGETQNIIEKYRSADVFCLPSIYEGFPNVICEAMSCGLPILCSNICDNPRLVVSGQNGLLFDPNNTSEIVGCLEKYLSMSETDKIAWGFDSRQKALRLFSKVKFLNQYQELIQSFSM